MATASLQAHDTWFFEVDPNSITWTYQLNTRTLETYGGKVVQILSVNWDNLSVDFDSGSGGAYGYGRDYLKAFGNFFKEAILWQRDTQNAATFSYPPRGYVITCFLDQLTIRDDLNNVKFPFTLQGKIQRDLMGNLRREAYSGAITRLSEGVGWTKNEYTYNSSTNGAAQGGSGGIAPRATQ